MAWLKRIKTFIYLIFAILLCIFSNAFLDNLNYLIGCLMIVYGLENIIKHFILKQKFNHLSAFIWGVMEIILGIIVLFLKEYFERICIIWSVWSLLRESNELKEVVSEINEEHHVNIINALDILESLIVIFFSIILIFEPTHHHALTHIYLLSFELVVNIGLPLLEDFCNKKKK